MLPSRTMSKAKGRWKGYALLYKGEPRNITLDPYKPTLPLVKTGWKRVRVEVMPRVVAERAND